MTDNLKKFINQFENEIYQNKEKNSLLVKIIDEIENIMDNYKTTEELVLLINENLNDMLYAMENGDHLKFIDIIKYEIIPLLDNIK